jgi:hypothetical protein
MVDTYCADCHNGTMLSASRLRLEVLDPAQIASNPKAWANVYRQLNAGTMPPFGAPRPDRATYAAALRSIEQALDTASPKPAASNSQQIATRLARLLWNSPPDAALLKDANGNRLANPQTLERQVRRMLADDRAQAFFTRFFAPWLNFDRLATAEPDPKHFPDYDPTLRDSFIKETELFVMSQLRANADPVELWSANYTFVNAQLARHYGVGSAPSAGFRRTSLNTAPERSGLLGQGSVLMTTSRFSKEITGGYTSPAARSTWLRLHYLGVPAFNPAPNAPPVKPELPITPQTRTLPANPCLNCHNNFFPLGWALENFDSIGHWRTRDQMSPVDASAFYVDGSPANGIDGLRKALLQYPDAFRTTITERLVTFASTGDLKPAIGTPETLIAARRILHGMNKPRWSAIIAGVVQNGATAPK